MVGSVWLSWCWVLLLLVDVDRYSVIGVLVVVFSDGVCFYWLVFISW